MRPQTRGSTGSRDARIVAVVLAAGRSRRMGAANKLLVPIDGRPMVARAVAAALGARCVARVTVVTGHEAGEVRAVLDGQPVHFVHNPSFADGMSTSLRAAAAVVDSEDVDGVVVCLGDMPWVTEAHIDALADAFDPAAGRSICLPRYQGTRGNPVLWARAYLPEMAQLQGDQGARPLFEAHPNELHFVDVADPGVLMDVDTRDALTALTAPNARAAPSIDGAARG